METDNANYANLPKRSFFYQALAYEFIGTSLITQAYNLGVKNPIIRALTYMISFIMAYNVSGGHFNPATSFAVYWHEKDSRK